MQAVVPKGHVLNVPLFFIRTYAKSELAIIKPFTTEALRHREQHEQGFPLSLSLRGGNYSASCIRDTSYPNYRHTGLDPASRIDRHGGQFWIPAFAGTTTFTYVLIRKSVVS